MEKFPWLENMAYLSKRRTPPGWTLENDGYVSGSNCWNYHRYERDTDLYVDVFVLEHSQSNKAEVTVNIMAERRSLNWGTSKTIISQQMQPRDFPYLAQLIREAYNEAEQLNPLD